MVKTWQFRADEFTSAAGIGRYGNNYTTALSNASIGTEIIALNPDFVQR